MSDTGTVQIICTILSGTFGALGAYFASVKGRKKDAIEQARRDQRIEDQMKRLAEKVEEHNGYSDKITKISESIVGIRADIGYLKHKNE